jgi:hypothetical protein
MVIRAKNPVHSVLFFILVFFNTLSLLVLLGQKNKKKIKRFIFSACEHHPILGVLVLLFCWDFCTILYNEGFIYRFSKEANRSFKIISQCHFFIIGLTK